MISVEYQVMDSKQSVHGNSMGLCYLLEQLLANWTKSEEKSDCSEVVFEEKKNTLNPCPCGYKRRKTG